MKKVVSLILVAVMLLLTFTACAGTATPSASPSAASPAASSAAASTTASASSSASTATSTKPALDEKNPIKIGYEAWASGPDAYFGLVTVDLLNDYIEELNANGGWLGRKIELVWYDISKDFSESVNVTNKLINVDKVSAIIGPDGSPFAIPLGAIVEAAKIPLLPNCGNVAVTKNDDGSTKPYTFRVAPVNKLSSEMLASYAYSELGIRKVATLLETTNIATIETAKNFTEKFKALGGQIVAEESYALNDNEFRAQITNIAKAKPDRIFMPAAAYKEVCNFAKQLNELGHSDIKILGHENWYNVEALKIAGKELEGCVLLTPGDMDDPMFAPLKEKYKAKHPNSNMEIHMYALYAVTALQFLDYAVKAAGSVDGEALKNALENMPPQKVNTGGTWNFDKDHNPVGAEFTVLEVHDSKFVSKGKYQIK